MNHINKILVTGGTGFLGAYIIKELVLKGYAVKALKRASSKMPLFIDASILDQVEWVEGDVLDIPSLAEAMQDVDCIIHSAAIVSFDKRARINMYKTNIEGTTNVVNVALEQNVKRLVFISSVAALGRAKSGTMIDEKTKWVDGDTNTAYAVSKFKAELEVWRGFAEGLEGCILNPATILGFGSWNDSSCALFKSVYKGMPWYTNGVNGFVAVEDVAKAAAYLCDTEITEERYVLVGDNWSFKKLLSTIAEGFGNKHPYKEATPFMSGIAWRLEKLKSFITGQKPLITKESAAVANHLSYYNGDKIKKAIPGFEYTPLEIAIQKACEQYKKQA